MKTKALFLIASIVQLTLASCTDEVQEMAVDQPQALKQIVMTTQDFHPEADGRTLYAIADGAVTCTWAENDTVGVFPNEGIQTAFPMASGAGTKNATFDGGGWALKDGSTYAAYYPSIGEYYLDKHAVPVSYSGQTQVGNASMAHLGAYDYMVATPTVPEYGSANFVFKHLSALVQLKLTVAQPVILKSVTLTAETDAFAVEGKVDIMTATPNIIPVTPAHGVKLDLQNVKTDEANQELTFYLMLPPVDLSNQTLTAVITMDKGVEEVTLESKNFQAGTAYALSASCQGMIVGDGSYKDGVVSLAEAGTMEKLLGNNYLGISSLKVVGPINAKDVAVLRQMMGADIYESSKRGKLRSLDLSDATVVAGGGSYYTGGGSFYTSNNTVSEQMFAWIEGLQQLTLPTNTLSIADEAFYSCKTLKSVIVPQRVTSIGEDAFAFNESLQSITIPDGVTSIGNRAFRSCTSLKSLQLPNSVTSIGDATFQNCTSLEKITLPDGITSIQPDMFYKCTSLLSVTLPENVTSIGSYAFYNCTALKSVYIPESVTLIEESAFAFCSKLVSVTIPEGITTIYERVFLGCSSLASVNIPSGVTSIDCYAFYQCGSLKSVYITDLAAWCRINFDCSKGSNPLSNGAKLYLANKLLTELVIPEGITAIKQLAFSGCTSITRVTIDADVTSIGECAFDNCSSLSSVVIGNNVTSLGSYAFSFCNSLVSASIGDGIQTISGWAFYNCASLSSLSLGKNVSSIGSSAFFHSPIKECYCYSTVPPSFNSTHTNSTFAYVQDGATLYVPSGCSSRYKSTAWSECFTYIKTKY